MKSKAIKLIKERSTYPTDNLKFIKSALRSKKPVSFFSWECPPRKIIVDNKNGRWVTFEVNIKDIVNGKKLDDYTEIPRITSKPEQERWFINKVLPKFENSRYIKIIADTNAEYIYRRSFEILGKKIIVKLSEIFKKELEIKTKKLLGNQTPQFYLYTKFQKIYKRRYNQYYYLVYNSLSKTNSKLVKPNIYKAWYKCMFDHIGFSEKDKEEREDVMKRAIASYAAEGMLFELLNKKGVLPNPVWVNWEEKPNLARASNILRKENGIEALPIIYFVKD